jgi:UDP-apiose/xylose synthase
LRVVIPSSTGIDISKSVLLSITAQSIKCDPIFLDHPVINVDSEKCYGQGYEDCDRQVPDVSKIRSLGWEPKFDLMETMTKAVEGFIDEFNSCS